jgi:D-alanine-D-alanine ligase
MTRRLVVGVLYGGRSGEHEISLRSALSVIRALDPRRYETVPIAITKDGRWWTGPDTLARLEEAQRSLMPAVASGTEVMLPADLRRRLLVPVGGGAPVPIDVVFPVLHGPFGEDGTMQGLLELADVPYVGSGVLASALGMDKASMKAVFRDAGIPVCRQLVTRGGEEDPGRLAARVDADLGFPCFVKPANLGSSVGISRVQAAAELADAVAEAASYDQKIVIEEAIDGREFECAVLGNESPEASAVGEIVPSREFYDYTDKYVEQAARIIIPASLPSETAAGMQALAVQAFRAIDASGLARVDFFLERASARVLVNEINTMPGCTPASMFPKLWEASGRSFAAVVDRLVELALERHATRARRRLSFAPPTPVSAARRSSGGSR